MILQDPEHLGATTEAGVEAEEAGEEIEEASGADTEVTEVAREAASEAEGAEDQWEAVVDAQTMAAEAVEMEVWEEALTEDEEGIVRIWKGGAMGLIKPPCHTPFCPYYAPPQPPLSRIVICKSRKIG